MKRIEPLQAAASSLSRRAAGDGTALVSSVAAASSSSSSSSSTFQHDSAGGFFVDGDSTRRTRERLCQRLSLISVARATLLVGMAERFA